MSLHHTNDPECPLCAEKLKDVNIELVDWFKWVKKNHTSIHLSWGFRDRKSQDEAFASGASKLEWPRSKHNHMNSLNEPDSLAVDLFEQVDGKALFRPIIMAQIQDESQKAGYKLRWGGQFKTLGDSNHFELA